MGLEVRLQPRGYIPKVILFDRPYGDQLPPPCQKGVEFISLGVRPGPGRRTHRLSKMGQARASSASVLAN